MELPTLTNKQQKFLLTYITNGNNATDAYKQAYGDTYGTASTDGYFVLPDFRNRAIWGSDSCGYIDAGLPDLYGYIGIPSKTSDGSLFYGTRSGDLYDHSSGGGTCQYGKMYFKASNYDAIYGNSDTVQPPAIRVRIKTRFI